MDHRLIEFVANRFMEKWFPTLIDKNAYFPDRAEWWDIAMSDAEIAAAAVLEFLGDDRK